jgi:hypothetical protein
MVSEFPKRQAFDMDMRHLAKESPYDSSSQTCEKESKTNEIGDI